MMKAKGARAVAVIAALVLIAFSSSRTAEAKTPGYILTGGDLGGYAMHFYTDEYLEHPNAEAVEVGAPDGATLEAPYLLYSTWPFAVAEELASGRPRAYLYAGERLVHNPETGAWLKLSDKLWEGSASWSGVGRAIDQARRKMQQAELPANPVLAAFVGREYDAAVYMVTTPDREPYRILGADFPLAALARALLASPVPTGPEVLSAGRQVYNVYATPRDVGTHLLFRYLPATDGQAGLIVPADAGDANAWASTPDFDRLFAGAKNQPLFSRPDISPSGGAGAQEPGRVGSRSNLLLLLLVLGAVALGALAGLALNLRRGLRGRRRA